MCSPAPAARPCLPPDLWPTSRPSPVLLIYDNNGVRTWVSHLRDSSLAAREVCQSPTSPGRRSLREASVSQLTRCKVAFSAFVKGRLLFFFFFSLCRAFTRAVKGQFASGHWLLQGVPRRVAAKLLKSELSPFISHQVIAIQFLEGNLFFPFFSMTWLYLNLPKFPPQLRLSVKFTCFFLLVFHFCLY